MENIIIWISGALFLGHFCKILSIPVLIGFILSGYIFSFLDYIDYNNILEIPSKIGIDLLLFSIGLHINPLKVFNLGYASIVLLHTIFVATIYFFLTNLDFVQEIKIILCLALTFSSTIIASKSLEERKELNSFHGKISIIILIFQDILLLGLLLYSSSTNLTKYSFLLILVPILIHFLKKILYKLKSDDELVMLTSLFLALFLGSYTFEKFGLTGEIGSLFIGILMSNYKFADDLSKKIWSIREFFLLFFFVSLGMKLNINAEILFYSILILLLLVIKCVILFILLLILKLRSYTAFLVSISLMSFSEFLLVLASLWKSNGIFNDFYFSIFVCSVCLSFIVGSILNKFVHEIFIKFEKFFIKLERSKHHPDEQPHTCGEATVMIVGMGRIGNSIFDILVKNNMKVVGFDANADLSLNYFKKGKRVTFADVEDPGFWSKLRFGKLGVIILSLPEFKVQNWSIQQARKFGFKGKIIVPTRSQGDPNILRKSGADEIYDAYDAAGLGVTKLLLKK